MASYEYSIYDDFIINHKVDITILQEEIEQSNIVTKINHIDANIDNDSCTIYFDEEITPTEEIELNTIISNHTGLFPGGISPDIIGDGEGFPSDIIFSYGNQYDDYHIYFKHTTYKIGSQFIFRGTDVLGKPRGIRAILKGKGMLRLFDRTNSNILFQWNNIDLSDWSILSELNINWPKNESILEVQGRQLLNSSEYLYCSCFMICYTDIL